MSGNNKEEQEVDNRLKEKAILILDSIAEGADEQTACSKAGIRRGTLIKWILDYPEFEKAMNTAKEMRADSFRSKISQMALDEKGNVKHYEKDEVPSVKASFDMLKWLAQVDNPEKYGTRVKHEGNIQPTQIVIDTGIKREQNVIEHKEEEEQSEDTSDLL